MAGGKDGQTLFHKILLVTTGGGGGGGGWGGGVRGTTNTTAVDWLLKVKNIEYDVGLT